MPSSITLSAGVRSNLLNLQNTADLKNVTQTRLSTGKKVNTALDNPSNFFTASALTARASDLSNLLDGMANGIQTIQAANNGLTSITTTLQSMQSTLNQARQDKSFQTVSYDIDPMVIGTSVAKKLTLTGGSVGTTGVDIDLNTITSAGSPPVQAKATSSVAYVAPTAGTPPVLTAGAAFTNLGVASGDEVYSFDITIGGGAPISISLNTADDGDSSGSLDLSEVVTGINAKLDLNAGGTSDVRARDDGTGKLEFYYATNPQAGGTIAIGNFNATGTAPSPTANFGFGAGNSDTGGAGQTRSFSINGTVITLNSVTGASGATAAASINSQLAAASVTGVTASWNTGTSRLEISGRADGTNNIAIAGADAATVFGTGVNATGTAAVVGNGSVKTVDQLVTAINGTPALNGKVVASNDNGKLRLQNLSTQDLKVTGVASGKADGSLSQGTIGGNTVRTSLAKQFNDLRDQITKFGDDASFNGINLLRADNMKLVLNENGTSFINVQAKDKTGQATSVDNAFLKTDAISAQELDSDATIDGKLDTLKDALSSIRSIASSLGSQLSSVQNRKDFTKQMINTLQVGSDNLTLADTNEEGANLLALNTRQSLQTTSLSFASQADQAVLQFLR
jgi:flagellin